MLRSSAFIFHPLTQSFLATESATDDLQSIRNHIRHRRLPDDSLSLYFQIDDMNAKTEERPIYCSHQNSQMNHSFTTIANKFENSVHSMSLAKDIFDFS